MNTKKNSRWLVTLGALGLLAASGVLASETEDETTFALAERLVELQQLESFFQVEWDFQMRQMEKMMEDLPDGAMTIPEGYLEAMRQQQVEGQVSDWIEAWTIVFDERRLVELVDYLERPESRDWVAARLEAYPHFLEALTTRAEAMVDVFQEDFAGQSEVIAGTDSDASISLSDIEPVTDSDLNKLFEFVPGSRIEAELDTPYFTAMSVPATDPLTGDVFSDHQIQLVSDGEATARVVRVSAQRAFSDIDTCKRTRDNLEQSLAGYFPDSQETDCGHMRYLAAGGDIRMTLSCREQKAVGASILHFDVLHVPTEEGAYRRFSEQFDDEEYSTQAGDSEETDGAD